MCKVDIRYVSATFHANPLSLFDENGYVSSTMAVCTVLFLGG